MSYSDEVLTKVATNSFVRCSKLTTVRLSSITNLGEAAFHSCSKLTMVILSAETMATLMNTNCFQATPIANGTGYIYVPRALVDSYKAATNWSTFANQFRALEDYTVDGTVTGELDESKI
jgi:hypothetical protein